MPCFTMQQVQTTLKDRDPATLGRALEEMGFTVVIRNGVVSFSGVYNETGMYHNGSYANGVLTTDRSLEVNAVKRAYAAVMVKSYAVKMGASMGKKLVKQGERVYALK